MANAAGSASSSVTSTSHTLTHEPLFGATAKIGGSSKLTNSIFGMDYLGRVLEPPNRHAFLQPPAEICDAAIEAVKSVLDGVAGGVCDEQAARLRSGKRKRGDGDSSNGLRIRKIHTDGFGIEQVWEQARRVIDALRGEVIRDLENFGDSTQLGSGEEEKVAKSNGLQKTLRFDEDGFEISSESESVEGELNNGLGREGRSEEDGNKDFVDKDEAVGAEVDELPGMEDEEDYQDDYKNKDEPTDIFVEDLNGLNDGFFSIDEFNKQTEFLEQQDAAGDPYTNEASDEEDIDWNADPMSVPFTPVSSSRRIAAMDVEDDDESGEDDEDGPTFSDTEFNAPDSDINPDDNADVNDDTDGGDLNTNNIFYKDFFKPPPRKVGKGERQANFQARQARKLRQPPEEDLEVDMERTIANVRRDIFDDNSGPEDSGNASSEADPSEPKSRRSAHERRQAKLAEEIRRLEAASVAKREWTLSGEARAADRPLNSLLEEDLDFQRTGKPVPVITAAVSESIEELIKRRVLAQEFDEVIRRRPDSQSVPSNFRRGAFEIDDSKPKQSLAEIYEEEHVKVTNPDAYVSKADDKLKKQHQEIELLWKDVSAKLDALSSWHYKPKPPVPSLTVVANVATVTMEDAQPSTASGMAGRESMLAPQEIYKAGEDKLAVEKGEIVPKSGVPVARQEMTREEKLRRRRREKSRIKKRGGVDVQKLTEGKKAKEKTQTVSELKKGGVKVIGRKGDIRDVDGNKVKAASVAHGAGGFKL